MKFVLPCVTCLLDTDATHPTPFTECFIDVEPRHDNVYRFKCPNGHETFMVMQNPRWELLFLMACSALIDGYPREAINSFVGCVEQFRVLAIRTILFKTHGRDNVNAEMWEQIGGRSERQLGSYVALWTSSFGSAPLMLDEKADVKVRNDVVHKGAIPSTKEATAFGQRVLALMKRSVGTLRSTHQKELDALATMDSDLAVAKHSRGDPPSGVNISTSLAVLFSDQVDLDLDGFLSAMRRSRHVRGVLSGWPAVR